MASVITINGVDRTAYCRLETVVAHNTIIATNDSLDVDISVFDGSFVPKAGNEIIWTNGGRREFAGTIMDIEESPVNPSHFKYKAKCRDYTWLLDRRLVKKIYASQAADLIVKDIITNFTDGTFTVANVQAAPSINSITFDYEYPSSCLRKIADFLQWGWYIDYNKDIHFFALETQAAPVASPLDIDASTNGDISDLVLKDIIQYEKNRIYLKGYNAKSTVTNTSTFTGDGTSKFFEMGYQPSALTDITVTRNGVTQTMKIDQVDGSPGDGSGSANDAFLCFSNMGLRWNVAPSNGDPIVATYNYLYPGISVVESPADQAIMKAREGTGDGIHESVIVDPALDDTIALDRGQAYLQRYASPRVIGAFDSYADNWRAGQSFTATSTKRQGGFTAKKFYVQSVTKTITSQPSGGTPVLKYHVEVADSPLSV